MMLVVCGVAINYTNADYIEHCLTDSQFRATHGHIHVGESIWADESQCEAEYEHTHLQYFPSIVAVASYVCHILGHSVCLPSTRQSISASLTTFSAVSDSFDNSLQSSIGPFVQSIDMPSTAETFQGFTQMLFKI